MIAACGLLKMPGHGWKATPDRTESFFGLLQVLVNPDLRQILIADGDRVAFATVNGVDMGVDGSEGADAD
jgi:hypothetical protein